MAQDLDWPTSPTGSTEHSGLDLKAILWERKLLLVFFALIGAGIGYLQFTKQPPVYRSDADVLVQHNQSQLAVDNFNEVRPSTDPIDTHIALFQTPVILQKAVESFHLNELTSLSGAPNPTATVAARLNVYRSPTSRDFLHFTYTCGNRGDSQQILEAVIATYLEFLGESQRSVSDQTVELITKAKDQLTKSLNEKEEAYQEFRDKASLLWAGEEGKNIHQQRLAKIESERSALMIQASQIRAELDSIQNAIEQGVPREALLIMADQARQRSAAGTSETPGERTITGQLVPLMIEEQLLLETLGNQHPKVLEVKKKVEVMRNLLAQESGQKPSDLAAPPDLLTVYVQSLKEEYRVNNEKIRELDKLFIDEKQAAATMGSEENRNRALLEDLDRTKGLFNVIVEQLQGISLTKDNHSLSGEVVNQPTPGQEVKSQVYTYVGLGGILGMIIGLGIGIMLEMGDKRFRSPEEVMQTMGCPILGHIPEVAARRNSKFLKDSQVSPTVVTYHRPQSRLAEAYRLVRTSLIYDWKQGSCRVIQFTSPDPGDGKSTMCSNVGVSIANSGKRCLIIDADLRRPVQHKIFGIDRQVGVASIIEEHAECIDCVQHTNIENLDVLAAGFRTDHPSELLHSPEFAQILEVFKEKYDFVLVDSPPVLAVTDATAIAPLVDSVLLIIKNTKHGRPHAKQSKESLDLVSAPVMGVVINGISEETGYRYEAGQYRRGLYGSGSSYSSYSYGNRAYRGYYDTSEKRAGNRPRVGAQQSRKPS